MRRTKRFRQNGATARLTLWGDDTATLGWVYSRKRGQGNGSALLGEIMAWADERNLSLYLLVEPYGPKDKGALTEEQLVEFYKKFGFFVAEEEEEHELKMMVRDSIEVSHLKKRLAMLEGSRKGLQAR